MSLLVDDDDEVDERVSVLDCGRLCVDEVCACKLKAAAKSAVVPHVINLYEVFIDVMYCLLYCHDSRSSRACAHFPRPVDASRQGRATAAPRPFAAAANLGETAVHDTPGFSGAVAPPETRHRRHSIRWLMSLCVPFATGL